MARRRRESKDAETPANLVDAAGHATRDTLAVARRGIIATPHHETVLFNILQGFLGAFAFARLATWGIRQSWWPSGDIHVSGRHIHHFIPGIVLSFGSGVAALTTRDERVESALAIPFGVGMGLTMDEAALLLDLARRLLDPAGTAQRAGQPRRDRHPGGDDPRAADAPPRRGEGRRGGRDPAARGRARDAEYRRPGLRLRLRSRRSGR